jgi:hypothetical protein
MDVEVDDDLDVEVEVEVEAEVDDDLEVDVEVEAEVEVGAEVRTKWNLHSLGVGSRGARDERRGRCAQYWRIGDRRWAMGDCRPTSAGTQLCDALLTLPTLPTLLTLLTMPTLLTLLTLPTLRHCERRWVID